MRHFVKMGARAVARGLAGAMMVGIMAQAVQAGAASGLVPVGPTFTIDLLDPAGSNSDITPAVALAADGSGVAAWSVSDGSTGYSYAMAHRFDANGTPLGPDIVIDQGPGGATYETTPVIASDAAGNFVVVWSNYNGTLNSMRLFAADGTPRTPAIALTGACDIVGAIGVTMDDAGDFAVLGFNGGQATVCFFQPDGSGGAVQTIAVAAPASLTSASISMNRQEGDVDVARLVTQVVKQNLFYYNLNSQILLQHYDSAGNALGTPSTVVNCSESSYLGGKTYGCNALDVSVARDDDDNSLVAWYENDFKGSASSTYEYARGYASTGTAAGSKIKVSPASTATSLTGGGTSVRASSPTDFIVTWLSVDTTTGTPWTYTLAAQPVGLNGKPIGPLVSLPPAFSSSNQAPGVAANNAGNFIGVWPAQASDQSQTSVLGQLYLLQ